MGLVYGGTFKAHNSIAEEKADALEEVDLTDLGKALNMLGRCANLDDLCASLGVLDRCDMNIVENNQTVVKTRSIIDAIKGIDKYPETFKYKDILITQSLGLRTKVYDLIKKKELNL